MGKLEVNIKFESGPEELLLSRPMRKWEDNIEVDHAGFNALNTRSSEGCL